jgi:hypothetical protein
VRPRPEGRAGSPEAPTVAFFLAFLGGVLVMVEGLALLAGGTEPFTVGVAAGPSQTAEFGGVGVAVGIGIVAAGFAVQENVRHRVGVGIALLTLAGISTLSGGGFALGLALSLAGGLVALVVVPTTLYAVPREAAPPRAPPAR